MIAVNTREVPRSYTLPETRNVVEGTQRSAKATLDNRAARRGDVARGASHTLASLLFVFGVIICAVRATLTSRSPPTLPARKLDRFTAGAQIITEHNCCGTPV